MKAAPQNPWGLTMAEVDAMDAMIKHFCPIRAAEATQKSVHTIHKHCKTAGQRMKTRGTLAKYLTYDRWRRGVDK